MSGRDLRSFLVSHRSRFQDFEEQKHLVTRAMGGLQSDRYRKLDYDEMKKMTDMHKRKAQHYKSKVDELQLRARQSHEHTLKKQHNVVWQESFDDMSRAASAENECEVAQIDFLNTYSVIDKEFTDDLQQCISATEEELEKFQTAIIWPINTLKSDLTYRLKEMRTAGETREQDVDAIMDQIDSVKTHSDRVLQWLAQQRLILEDDVEQYLDTPNLAMPLLDQAIPADVFFYECPVDEVKNSILHQFVSLHSDYASKFEKEKDRIKELTSFSPSTPSKPWNSTEKWIFQTVSEIYNRYAPEHLQRKIVSLLPDMLGRLLPGRNRWDIFEMSALDMRLKFAKSHQRSIVDCYRRDFNDLHAKTWAVFGEVTTAFHKSATVESERQHQKRICEKLHRELDDMRKIQAEVMRLEELLAEEERERKEREREEEQRRNQLRRTEIHNRVAEYQRRKVNAVETRRKTNQQRLNELKREMEKQRKYDRQRVEHRQFLHKGKLEMAAQAIKDKEEEEAKRLERLEALRNTVAITAESNPERMVQDTQASRARAGVGANQDVDIQAPLFRLHGYSENEIGQDMRLRAELALRKAGLHKTDYARQILSTMQPPSQPRRDADSSAFQALFTKEDT